MWAKADIIILGLHTPLDLDCKVGSIALMTSFDTCQNTICTLS